MYQPARPDPYILTPRPSPQPRINGPRVFGVRPLSPVLFKVAATGDGPLTFTAEGLPFGLNLAGDTGLITGRLDRPGEHRVHLTVAGRAGRCSRDLRIVCGDAICLTPPMGWNSWYCWSESVSAEKVLATARAFVARGLVDHGWTYVNIDDCWQGPRGGPLHAIQPNERFPDMAALCNEVHAFGLKIGIYSTPWMGSYAGFRGGSAPASDGCYASLAIPADRRLQPNQLFGRAPIPPERGVHRVGPHWFADADACQWAEWGIDFVKYDWYPNDVPTAERLGRSLRACGRDIVFSLSNNAPLEHAADWARLCNLWRTTGDIRDDWDSTSGIGFSQDRWSRFAGPGHWNDPDMLQVGRIGVTNQFVRELRKTNLSPDEQYTQVSLWALLAAPLIVSCDVESMDDFTLGLLTNDEIIEVNQDPLGCPARPVRVVDGTEVWAKPMLGGTLVVGLFNRTDRPAVVRADWDALAITGPRRALDLWRQTDIGWFDSAFAAEVPAHGAIVIRLDPSVDLTRA